LGFPSDFWVDSLVAVDGPRFSCRKDEKALVLLLDKAAKVTSKLELDINFMVASSLLCNSNDKTFKTKRTAS